jgi:hypothetical protein
MIRLRLHIASRAWPGLRLCLERRLRAFGDRLAICSLTRVNALNLIQWPAMVVTVAASWFVASRSKKRRQIGFWLFLLSNILWVIWAVSAQAYALLVLQLCLAFMNIRGERRNT